LNDTIERPTNGAYAADQTDCCRQNPVIAMHASMPLYPSILVADDGSIVAATSTHTERILRRPFDEIVALLVFSTQRRHVFNTLYYFP